MSPALRRLLSKRSALRENGLMCGGKKLLLLPIAFVCVVQGALLFVVLYSSTLSQQSRSSYALLKGTKHVGFTKDHEGVLQLEAGHNLYLQDQDHVLLKQQKIVRQPGGPDRQHKNMQQPQAAPRMQSESSHNCSDDVCSSLLQYPSRMCYLQCGQMVQLRALVSDEDIPKHCKFRESQGHVPVALVSVPGSGNTWVRGLLEKATGVCTGSIYCDIPLRVKGFIGESVRDGGVLVVKTHTSDYQWIGMKLKRRNQDDSFYGSAILLIRNPFDTFVSERHRSILLKNAELEALRADQRYGVGMVKHKDGSHVHASNKEAFGNVSGWGNFSRDMGERWQKTIVEWSTSNHSILVVRYEDLVKDSLSQVTRMLDFLNHDYDRAELALKLQNGFIEFQRNHTDSYEHYSLEQKKEINAMIMATLATLRAHHLDHLFQIKEYMATVD